MHWIGHTFWFEAGLCGFVRDTVEHGQQIVVWDAWRPAFSLEGWVVGGLR